jgi:type II secretory pathway pseudopilin PulG
MNETGVAQGREGRRRWARFQRRSEERQVAFRQNRAKKTMMKTMIEKARQESGFTLLVVLLAIVLMSALGLAALVTADDEQRASSAVRQSSAAFYVAEAGLNEVFANWSNYAAQVDSLAAGDSVDLGWQTLTTGDSYRPVVHRWDTGDQPLYELVVHGRSKGLSGGLRTLSYQLTSTSSEGAGYMLGECCDAAITMKGTFGQRARTDSLGGGGTITHSGYDQHPPGWEDAGVCLDSLYDKPGLVMSDTTQLERLDARGGVEGVPPIMEDPGITDATFENFGDYSWEDIKDRATVIVEDGYIQNADGSIRIEFDSSLPSQKLKGTDHIGPRYTVDFMTGEVICDTSHPMNWGSDDPNDPCFNHFPVILLNGEVDMVGPPTYGDFYGQGILIADWDEVARTGSEIEFEQNVRFRGITLGRGCIELQKGAQYYGAIFLNASYDGVTCDKSYDMYEDCYGDQDPHYCRNTTMQWSQCAVDRAMVESGLYDMAEPTINTGSGGAQRLGSRSFSEMF